MKIKKDFVTNSSSTSFIFVFKGKKRSELFKQLVRLEKEFDIIHSSWNNDNIRYDVWDLIEILLGIIKKGPEDRFYQPDLEPISKLVDTLQKSLEYYKKCLKEEKEEEKSGVNNYILNLYSDSIEIITHNLKVITDNYLKGEYSSLEISFGNDGMITGSFGDAMEQLNLNIQDDGLFIIRENNH